MDDLELIKKYPWLGVSTTLEKYIDPEYYDRILKEYVFDGKTDLDFLKDYITKIPKGSKVLELGPGTGRVTNVVLENLKEIKKLTLVDLSDRMLAACKKRFIKNDLISYINSDTVDFLLETNEKYDFAFSLWSFSHSVHQNIERLGKEEGKKKVSKAISRFLTGTINPKGSFFLMHFDSLSEEQKISIKQRKKDLTIFESIDSQSPSKILIDEVFTQLSSEEKIKFTCQKFSGRPLEFRSLDEALEYYLNFHMESHFNNSDNLQEIISELSLDIEKHKDEDGIIRIEPGCFIYEVTVN